MTNRDRDNNDKIENILDAIDGAAEVVRQNKDLLDSVMGDSSDESLDLREPLSDAQVTEDEVVVVAELKDEKPEEMGVRFEEGVMYMTIGDLTLRARVPDDVIQESVDASMNNGVLRVSVDRATEENTTSVSIKENKDDSIMSETDKWETKNNEEEEEEDGDEDGSV